MGESSLSFSLYSTNICPWVSLRDKFVRKCKGLKKKEDNPTTLLWKWGSFLKEKTLE